MKEFLKINKLFAIIMIILLAFSRLISLPPNFTPILAMALFGGAVFSDKRLAIIIPLLAMLLSDLFLNYHDTIYVVYFCIALIAVMGILIRENRNVWTIAGASVGASVFFFIVSNFGVWLFTGWYPGNFTGLLACYAAAIPFYHNTMISTLLFSGVLFGLNNFAEKYSEKFEPAKAKSTR